MFNRDQLVNLFLEKNKEINLSAIRDTKWVRNKHIQDSLELEKLVQRKPWINVIDVWTGGWFPLMPLAISHPECNFVWVDSVRKKTIAVWEILSKLWVENVEMIWSRIEDIKGKQFDVVTARAVAYADKLIDWVFPITKKWWTIFLMKQESGEEKEILLKKIKEKKLIFKKEHHYKLFDDDINRVVYIIQK